MFDDEPQQYKLFISQLEGSTEEYDKLVEKLKSIDSFIYENHSILGKTSKEELKDQMKPVDVVVILSGFYSKDADLIQREIDVAVELKKPIVIVRPYGLEVVPGSIEEAANEVIGWNAHCIIDSIVESSPYENYED
jgi:hypothetical protein